MPQHKSQSMLFTPETYKVKDEPMTPFIDEDEIWNYLATTKSDSKRVRAIIQKSFSKKRLSLEETACLIKTDNPDLIDEIKNAARSIKQEIYGDRIVLFAPLYIGNKCTNNCLYCGFRASNTNQQRITLATDEIIANTKALEDEGHKRLILVFGEHPDYDADYIAETVRTVYKVRNKNGKIRRVNINAAPLSIDGFKKVKEAGIGTYQIFQETYHKEAYAQYHKSGKKSDYNNRLISLDKAQEAGLNDVGIGALFGLFDWRFEVMALIRHVNHLEACYNVGPHTISFPRLTLADNAQVDNKHTVSDSDFEKLIAIIRLAVPYTGMILTAREPQSVRDRVIKYGCSQIDGGTNISMGAYVNKGKSQNQQFAINDERTLREVIENLIESEQLPSFCTSCYRQKRTGEHFMEFSIPGFIKRYCEPNALFTFAEYLEDYSDELFKQNGYKLIINRINKIDDNSQKYKILERLERIQQGERDLYF